MSLRSAQLRKRLKALVFTTVFPNTAQPVQGVFVRERIRHLAPFADMRVVAPVPWFKRRRVPATADQAGLRVTHPTFFYTPRIGKRLDGFSLYASTWRHISRVRQTFPFDLLDAHFAYPDGYAAVLLARSFNVPAIVTLRGSEEDFAQDSRRRSIAWTVQRADSLIAVSQPLADLAIALGAPSSRVHVVANGVDPAIFRRIDRQDARRELEIGENTRLIVSAGQLIPRKGFDRVIKAFTSVSCAFPNSSLIIAGGAGLGSGTYPQELNDLIAAVPGKSDVRLIGPQSPAEMSRWFNAADLFVLASSREGCPNVVCEALACGCPVVASRVGHLAHMVDNSTGVLFDDPFDVDALAEALRHALRAPWDRSAIATSSRRTWNDVAEQVLRVWQQTLSRAEHHGAGVKA